MPRQIKAASAFGEVASGERCHAKSKPQPPLVSTRDVEGVGESDLLNDE